MQDKPLQGLRVLDFTWILAGPYATRTLADFGAEVIKVQSAKTANGVEQNTTGYFNNWNRNKRSITLDLSHPEAREIILKLTSITDVLTENFSPRVMSNWGLTYEKLKEVKSDLIMLSMSAMGQTGPWKDYVAYGQTLQALSGLTYLTSPDKESPQGLGYAYSDFVSGLYAALAVLAALERRDKTGQGQHIDLSEQEALCTLMGPSLMAASINDQAIQPQGNCPDYIRSAPCGCYPCSGEDRWCVLEVANDQEWQILCDVMGRPDWSCKERFSSMEKRKADKKELDEYLAQWTRQHRAEKIVELLQKAGIAAGVVQNAEDLSRDPQLIANDFFVHLPHPVLGETISERSPIRLAGNSSKGWKAAPLLGEDNRYVFLELLRMTEGELADYTEKGIIR